MLGPLELERDAVGEGAQPVEPMEVGQALDESHVVQLADCARRQTVTTRLFPRERLLLDDKDVVACLCEPIGGGSAGRTAADHEHLVAAGRGGHQCPPVASPAAAPSVVQFAGTGSWPDSTTRS